MGGLPLCEKYYLGQTLFCQNLKSLKLIDAAYQNFSSSHLFFKTHICFPFIYLPESLSKERRYIVVGIDFQCQLISSIVMPR